MDARLDDAAWLGAAYAERPIRSIADELGVGRSTVRNRMVQFGIERRTTADWMRGKPKSAIQRAKMSATRTAYWDAHPDRQEFKSKISKSRRRSGVKMGYPTAYDPERRTDHEHRMVAERKLGRALREGEVVHHINFDKTDNSPENLAIMSQSEHARIHYEHRNIALDGRFLP